MPKALKWLVGIFAGLVVLVILAVAIAPLIINLDKYRPQIEAQATKALDRPVKLGGKLEPSIFPWIGIEATDVNIGNPAGFESKDFVSVNSFEVRVKLLPLLSREVEISRLVVKNPEIVLEMKKDGKANWEGMGAEQAPEAKPEPEPSEGEGLPIRSLQVGELSIVEGRVTYIDHAAGTRQEITNFNLSVNDFSLDRPFDIRMNAIADGKPVAATGTIGPVGPEPGKSPLPLDLKLSLLNNVVRAALTGRIDPSGGSPRINLNLSVDPFSPRRLLAELRQPLAFEPADKNVLQRLGLSMQIDGSPEKLTISNGVLLLDDSRMTFEARAQDFSKPDLTFKAALDGIDADRYLPPPAEPETGPAKAPQPDVQPTAQPDFAPLRKLVLDADIKVGQLKIQNARMQNVTVKATAKNGIIRIDPQSELYSGKLVATSVINVQQAEPRSTATMKLDAVLAGRLLKDVLDKDIVEGALSSDLNLQFSGIDPQSIRRTLTGQGLLSFKDGAIVGIDLANMVRNVQAAFGLAERPTEKPRTDFSEMLLPFTMKDGVTQINEAQLNSPLLRVSSNGTVDLVEEMLDVRVSPKFVATLVGQEDVREERAGIMVPVLIQGPLTEPRFRPDLQGMLQQQLPGDLEQRKQEAQKEIEKKKEELQQNVQKKAQELLRGLPFGNPQPQQ
jgi:AsmA protein